MDDAFKIYTEQLRDGHIEKINEVFSSDFIDIHERDLDFRDSVILTGEAYLADDNLILKLKIRTTATLPCVVCNEPLKKEVRIENFYHVEPLEEIKGRSCFNFKDVLREAIVLEAPAFAECLDQCPHRREIKKYLKNPLPEKKNPPEDEGYRPFSDLKWDK
jgi:uncharacterized metal-binding protein YceD (DUF177 family)